MSTIKNPLELYQLLNKSNCGECSLPSCMAFAVAVIQGQKSLEVCPYLDLSQAGLSDAEVATRKSLEDEQLEQLNVMKQAVANIDLTSAAGKLGARVVDGRIAVNCLGKDFHIDGQGGLLSDCHCNLWVHGPLLNYIINCKGRKLAEEWISFHELDGAAEWSRFFAHRCEEDMKKMADAHPELFFEILDLFGASPVEGQEADHSLLLHPLPRLPLVINYWDPEKDFPSELNILFDVTAPENLEPGFIYTLCRGLVEMFRALIVKHNRDGKLF